MEHRRFVHPQPGDDLATIAARELPDAADGADLLLSWNLHLAARSAMGRPGSVLPSDLVFVEPPVNR